MSTKSKTPTTITEPEADSYPEELARYFALAYISYMQDISFETARKRYGHETPGPLWFQLAELAAHGATRQS
jgi:hypothetical protein